MELVLIKIRVFKQGIYCRLLESGMELTRAERQIDVSDVRIGFLVLLLTSLTSRVSHESILNVSVSVVLFSPAAETAASGTNAYSESSRFTGVSLVDANDRSNSRTKTGGMEASSICSLSTSGTSDSATVVTSLKISSACEGVTWLAIVRGRA